jgi:hypothetical protein
LQRILQKQPRQANLPDEFACQTDRALDNLAAEAGARAQFVEIDDEADKSIWVAA